MAGKVRITLVLLNGFLAGERLKPFTSLGRKGAYAPTTLTTLASLVPKELDATVELIDEFVTPFDPFTVKADLVGLSFTTPNAIHAYRLSQILRQRGITVVMGGYHVTAMPEEASEHADACVLGYAERSWPQLLIDFQNERMKPVYRQPFEDDFVGLKVVKHHLVKRRKYFYPHTVEFSRSCNNACRFCVIPNFCGRGMIYRSKTSFASEIRQMGADEVVLLDSSPAENLTEFISMCHLLKELNVKWYSAITFKLSKHPKIVKLMADSGCKGALIGFESLNENSLNSEKKKFNRPAEYKDFVELLHSHKIYVFGCFVFGFDEDDQSVFDRTIQFVDECAIDLVHYAILTPFPGSPLFEDLKRESRILTYDWSKYDSLHATFKPKNMTADELQSGFKRAYLKTHALPSIIRRSYGSPCRSKTIFLGNLGLGLYGRKILE